MSARRSQAVSNNFKAESSMDKMDHTLVPHSPSQSSSSPGLTQSTSDSISNSPDSSPQPTTPLRLSRSRYPELGRVPLHRRGTSKTYERMEDLLREAGYKETRIFTPESEQRDSSRDHGQHSAGSHSDDNRATVRNTVIGFLAGLMPGANASRSKLDEEQQDNDTQQRHPSHGYSPPASPLLHRETRKQNANSDSSYYSRQTDMTSSLDSLGDYTPRASYASLRAPSSRPTTPSLVNQPPPNSRNVRQGTSSGSQRHHASHQISRTSTFSSIQEHLPVSPPPPANHIAYPRPSRAGAYLRHMASVPNIPQRPSSTPAFRASKVSLLRSENSDDGSGFESVVRGNGEGEEDYRPPLPRTWLETVARAVLFGGMGAYAGGPVNSSQNAPLPPRCRGRPTLRPTRSSVSQTTTRNTKHGRSRRPRSRLSDQKNTMANSFLGPPPLFTQLQRGRSGRSETAVSRTRVVCRSAPSSRTASVTRGSAEEKSLRAGKEHMMWRHVKREQNQVPSLARTRAEGDVWDYGNGNPHGIAPTHDSEEDRNDNTNDLGLSSDDEDDELDLAKILVHPKRQNSIKSLRKHLASEAGSSSVPHLLKVNSSTGLSAGRMDSVSRGRFSRWGTEDDMNEESGAEEWGQGWTRKGSRRNTQEDEDEASFGVFRDAYNGNQDGGARNGSGKGRVTLPSAWRCSGS